MLDVSVCQATIDSRWANLSPRLYRLLVDPRVIMPILAMLVAAPWAFRSWRWKRQVSLVGILLVLLFGLGLSPLGGKLGFKSLAMLVPEDSGQPADAIVILGRGRNFSPSRVQVAVDLWQQQRAPLIFASGRDDAIEIGQMLETAGVPSEAIDGEPCSATTNENALFTAALLHPQGVKQLILVTDLPHMARSQLTFRSLGFEVIPHPSPLPSNISPKRQQLLVIRECAGLITYGILGRYFKRSTENAVFNVQFISRSGHG